MKAQANLVAAAFSLTALAYGLARFAYGLLLPRIRDELALGVETDGWIGGGAFAAYCAGILLTFYCNGRLGPRAVALAAGLAATAGMGLVAIASSGWTLGLGIALAGLSTGLASPPLATAVASRIGAADRPKANGIINTGTAAGIVLSGAASLLAAEAWREIYLVFVAIGAVVTAWLWFAAAGAFGAAYIIASGAYLIQGIERLPRRPDLGLGIPFLALALGQAAGNPLFGSLLERLGAPAALGAFAGAACVAVALRPRLPTA